MVGRGSEVKLDSETKDTGKGSPADGRRSEARQHTGTEKRFGKKAAAGLQLERRAVPRWWCAESARMLDNPGRRAFRVVVSFLGLALA